MTAVTCGGDGEQARGRLRAAHAVLRHALVQAVVLRAHVQDAQRARADAVALGRRQWAGVVQPHDGGRRPAAHLAGDPHRVAVGRLALLQLHRHLRRLCGGSRGGGGVSQCFCLDLLLETHYCESTDVALL